MSDLWKESNGERIEHSPNTDRSEEGVDAGSQADTTLAQILDALVSERGKQILLKSEELRRELLRRNVPEAEVDRLALMTGVTGFRALLEKDERTQQADLDRYVANAVRETELNRATVLRLTHDIAWAAGVAFDYVPISILPEGVVAEQAFTVPASLYEQELEAFRTALQKRGEGRPPLPFNRLFPLVTAGIPRAKYYYGYCLLHGVEQPEDNEMGLRLMNEAAAAGDPLAAAELGDYWFARGPRNWGRAYSYYTGFGAMALTRARQEAMKEILNQQHFNRKLLRLSVIFFLLLFSTLFFVPGVQLWAAYRAVGWICAALGAGLLVYTKLRCRVRPYESIYFAPVGVFGLWALYTLIRLLF